MEETRIKNRGSRAFLSDTEGHFRRERERLQLRYSSMERSHSAAEAGPPGSGRRTTRTPRVGVSQGLSSLPEKKGGAHFTQGPQGPG